MIDTLSELPNWRRLTKKEKSRVKRMYKPRTDQKYNIDGALSISETEQKRWMKD